MDTGEHNDYSYYEGYEGEPEFILSAGNESIHIWDGYISDIFGDPIMDGKGWKGLTRDFNEMTGPFSGETAPCKINVKEYLDDAETYKGCETSYEESVRVLDSLIKWMSTHLDDDVFANVE